MHAREDPLALRFVDSFAHYAIGDITKKWVVPDTSNLAIATTAGRFGGPCLSSSRFERGLTKPLTSQASWYLGVAWYVGSVTAGVRILSILDGTTPQVFIVTDAANRIQVTRNGTVLATSVQALSPGIFYYVELGVTIGTAGTYQVRVNGATWISGAGNTQATGNATADTVGIGSQNSTNGAATLYYGDFYACDGTGSKNNSFLGDVRVDVIFPNANGDVNQWTASGAGSNYACVDQTNEDGDTTYVTDANVGDYDFYKFGPLPSAPQTVYGVQTVLVARKDDAGIREIAPSWRSGGVNHDGTAQAVGSAYSMLIEMDETNPASGVAWAPSDLASGTYQAGVKVVS